MGLFRIIFGNRKKQNTSTENVEKGTILVSEETTDNAKKEITAPTNEEAIKNILENGVTLNKAEVPPHPNLTKEQVGKIIDYLVNASSSYEDIDYEETLSLDMERLDPLFEDAARLVVIHQQGTTSLIQRKFAIGYNRAGRIMDQLERTEIVGPIEEGKARDVLCNNEEDLELRLQNIDHYKNAFSPEKIISEMSANELKEFKNKHSDLFVDRVAHYNKLQQQYEERVLRSEIEAEKERIKQEQQAKKRARDIREAAMRELAEEGIIDSEYLKKRESIPQKAQDAVWNRDGGRCVKCGSQESLEFDHIIPFSKGGSNSIRNLQLLCKKCNLEKSNKIG